MSDTPKLECHDALMEFARLLQENQPSCEDVRLALERTSPPQEKTK
jgi:hypothetical protein